MSGGRSPRSHDTDLVVSLRQQFICASQCILKSRNCRPQQLVAKQLRFVCRLGRGAELAEFRVSSPQRQIFHYIYWGVIQHGGVRLL